MNGVVKFYNPAKGYGFIVSPEGEDYFFHVSDVTTEELPEKGDFVDFTPSTNKEGRKADSVSIVFMDSDPATVPEPPRAMLPRFFWHISNSLLGSSVTFGYLALSLLMAGYAVASITSTF